MTTIILCYLVGWAFHCVEFAQAVEEAGDGEPMDDDIKLAVAMIFIMLFFYWIPIVFCRLLMPKQ